VYRFRGNNFSAESWNKARIDVGTGRWHGGTAMSCTLKTRQWSPHRRGLDYSHSGIIAFSILRCRT